MSTKRHPLDKELRNGCEINHSTLQQSHSFYLDYYQSNRTTKEDAPRDYLTHLI